MAAYIIPAKTKCLVRLKGSKRVIDYETRKPIGFAGWDAWLDSGWYVFKRDGNLIEVRVEDVVIKQ